MTPDLESLDPNQWAERVRRGERRAIARLISWLEDGRPFASKVLSILHREVGRAHRIGFTGPPGCGKSSLVDRLVGEFRAAGRKVAVVAVDPSSPFTGGAILGDRIRMQRHAGDPGVFIRSMSSRGNLGGLAIATQAACHVLDASGHDVILIETVGVGQSELDIVGAADTVVLVQAPNLGDGIQAIKAGIMEIPDIFVVNKGDLPGSDRTLMDLRDMLHDARPGGWSPVACKVSAQEDVSLGELRSHLDAHLSHLRVSGERLDRRRKQVSQEILGRALYSMDDRIRTWLTRADGNALLEAVLAGNVDPISASRHVVDHVIRL
ncbi:MAG: methylmalonyl Co-A mutase-associated GTPase MeaB [bacterium]|nr:methylmalonyl Co-A mutase-associated GTPase MeaB [bacterium]